MGSRLTVLAVALIMLASAQIATADKKQLAQQLFELGIEEYKAKDYAAAAVSMNKSYALDPQPNALYALAQAERLAGDCNGAVVHYKQLLDTSKDEQIIKAVKTNLELCSQIERGEKTTVDAQEEERRDAPILQIRTVYRTEQKSDKLAIAMYAGGGIALGGSVAMFLMARSALADADRASTLDEYNDLYDRSRRLRWMSYAAAGTGLALVTWATLRIVYGDNKPKEREVALVPVPGGSMFAWSTSW
jgi:tetratricopeptide (TPR) repeat protein